MKDFINKINNLETSPSIDVHYKTREIICLNLGCWFIKTYKTVDATGLGDKILELKLMSFKDYKKINDFYPMIYLGNGLITEYSELIPIYNFMPTSEYAEEEKCFLNLGDSDMVDVIVSSAIITKQVVNKMKDDVFGKHQKLEDEEQMDIRFFHSKTYLMIDGNGYYKIGKSFSPIIRESTLQSENPTIELLYICDIDIENMLHKKYSEFRKRGEWFELSKKQILDIVTAYNFNKV